MHILVTGAAGMIGRKLTERLAKDGALHGRAIEKLTLADVFSVHSPPGVAADVAIVTRDLASAGVAESESMSLPSDWPSNLTETFKANLVEDSPQRTSDQSLDSLSTLIPVGT